LHGLFVNKKKNDTGSTALVLKRFKAGTQNLRKNLLKTMFRIL